MKNGPWVMILNSLARYIFLQFPPCKKDEVAVEVTFEITKEYVLNVGVRLLDKDGNEIRKAGMDIKKVGV